MAPVRFAIRGPIERTQLPGLCQRVCALLERSRAGVMLCDVTGVDADAVCVDALARLALAARRHQCLIRLQGVSPELAELVALMGLEQVLLDKPPVHGEEHHPDREPPSAGRAEDRA